MMSSACRRQTQTMSRGRRILEIGRGGCKGGATPLLLDCNIDWSSRPGSHRQLFSCSGLITGWIVFHCVHGWLISGQSSWSNGSAARTCLRRRPENAGSAGILSRKGLGSQIASIQRGTGAVPQEACITHPAHPPWRLHRHWEYLGHRVALLLDSPTNEPCT